MYNITPEELIQIEINSLIEKLDRLQNPDKYKPTEFLPYFYEDGTESDYLKDKNLWIFKKRDGSEIGQADMFKINYYNQIQKLIPPNLLKK